MMKYPISYFENNIVFNDGSQTQQPSCWAVYKLEGINYDFLSDQEKVEVLKRLTRVVSSFTRLKVFIIPTHDDVNQHFKGIKKRLNTKDPLYDNAVYHADMTKAELQSKMVINGGGYSTYIAVKLINDDMDIVKITSKKVAEFVKQPAKILIDFLTAEPGDVPSYVYEKYKKIEKNIYLDLSSKFNVKRLEPGETQWIEKRIMHRGLNKPILMNKTTKVIETEDGEKKTVYSTDWQPKAIKNGHFLRPYKKDVVNIFSGEIEQGKRHLKIIHDDGTISFQSFLVLTHMPDTISFPGMEWIYMLQILPMQIEVCMDIDNIDYKSAVREISKKKTELKSQVDEAITSGFDIPDELLDAQQMSETLEGELKDAHLPLCKATVSFCLSSDNLDRLEEDVNTLRGYYSDRNIILERPLSDQLKLFAQHIPGSETYLTSYIHKLSPLTLASGVFGVVNKLGDDQGYYIGKTGKNQNVYLYLGKANLMNKSAAATFYGDLGYGKSFNTNLLLYLHVLYGAYGLVIDPKSERSRWTELPLIGDLVNIVTITPNDEYKGTLDPFNTYRDNIEQACERAQMIITDLLQVSIKDDEFSAINEALHKIKSHPQPSMQALIEMLLHWDQTDSFYEPAYKIGRRIDSMRQIGATKLLIGDGSEKAIQFKNRLNVIQIDNIKIPSDPNAPRESYTLEENVSSVVMGIVADFARRFSQSKEFTVALFDESWFVTKTKYGLAAIEYLCRTNRSLYSSILLNGHGVGDIPSETIKNTITYKFCFHTSSTEEAIRMLEYMKIEPTPENMEILTGTDPEGIGLKNGQALFQDAYGRVGVITFDAVFDDIIEAFKTTPIDSKKQQVLYEEVSEIMEVSPYSQKGSYEKEGETPAKEGASRGETMDIELSSRLEKVLKRYA